jgi:imidazolonepropionase-like amidohydrolase
MNSTRFAATLRVLAWITFLLLLSMPAFFITRAGTNSGFMIRNARVFDGRKVLDQTDVWVDDAKIKAVGKNLKVPSAVKTIDAAGDTLLPGLIDSHTHAWGDALKQSEIFGVTTELDMFTDMKFMQQTKKDQAAGKDLDWADLFSAGSLATAPGGHGTEYGVPVPTLSSPSEAQAWVDARIAEGSDYIKIIVDDGSAYGSHRPTLNMETVKALIDAAHRRGKLVVVHIGTQKDAREVVNAGADGLAHLFADSAPGPDFASLAAAHHVFVVPTLTVLESVSGIPSGESLTTDSRLAPYLTADDTANLKRSFGKMPTAPSEKYAEQTVAQLKAAHVPLLAGTDAPNPGTTHGASIHRELELLVRSGLTPQEALVAATSVPAATFHLGDRGVIAPGKRADLLLVKGDPMRDITATRDIVSVWKLGVEDDRASYRAAIEKAKKEAPKAAQAQAPAPAGSESGLISDFDDGTANTKFGMAWMVSTDAIAGGKSTGEMKVVDGGANQTKHALEVSGVIDGGLPYAWSGVMFSPGAQPFAPVNLSARKNITFFAKGDGQTYRVLFFTESGGRMPSQQSFTAGAEWKKFSIPFSAFDGTDGHDISAILFVGGPARGKFDFQIDEVKLE